ncbi:hypothetical protein [Echinimonas agarilytica]|uniref:Uncharacterized protein n=1 Tax=Echinimonas agarilytica TaxID=1215918 RepID=A0AA41W466_9GAMM|nr:hypothetical protein [Echinimonas agarilytica]MCM2678492.1 hypothetical protein [Echinimonas agarilytica]
MPIQYHSEDFFPHLETHKIAAEKVSEKPTPINSAIGEACITLFSLAGASLKVC